MLIPSLFKKYQSTFIIATIFAFSIFAQSVLFHYLIYHEILFSSLWTHTEDFIRFYLPHISIALFLASFVFLFRNKWWLLAISLLIDIWILANLWYYRANDFFIDQYTIFLIDNMAGFWDSILALFYPIDLIFIGLTLLVGISIYLIKRKLQKIRVFTILIITSITIGLFNGLFLVKKHNNEMMYINPILDIENQYYLQEHTILHYFILTIKRIGELGMENKYTLTAKENQIISKLINSKNNQNNPSTKLIICIVESFNSFVLTDNFMPNLNKFINDNNVLFAPNIISQEKNANSADGQMLIQTGLLPVSKGATCERFPFNKYPSLSSLYNSSAGLFPNKLNCWNQKAMSRAYSIDTSIVTSRNDTIIFSQTIELSKKYDNVMMLTIASHLPCKQFAELSSLSFPDTIPILMQNYIKSLNVTDKAMNILFNEIENNNDFKKTTIVITGDHKLPISNLTEFNGIYNYSKLIPLIIYSPNIKEKTIITDTCYQMDIYPTILHAIGCEDYYWKGFGVNLIDSSARLNRQITPEAAFDLSDKIIRADYFNIQ